MLHYNGLSESQAEVSLEPELEKENTRLTSTIQQPYVCSLILLPIDKYFKDRTAGWITQTVTVNGDDMGKAI